MYRPVTFLILLLTIACTTEDDISALTPESPTYFPPIGTNEWATIPPEDLAWNATALDELRSYLVEQHTKSFMVLVNGRIVVEEYYNGHSPSTSWQWNSAGKTLVTAATGIAQQNQLIELSAPISKYLGEGWTSTALEKEVLITVRNLLSMTSGLNDEPQRIVKANLTYLADAGERWAYGNVFQALMNVVAQSSQQSFDTFFNDHLQNQIGMTGFWKNGLIFRIYHSDTRSMARFGLLAAQKGNWDGKQIVDEDFFDESTNSSQEINPSYGYLWWLNGKTTYMLPSSQDVFDGQLISNAPADLIAAMGKNEQRIYLVPSKDLVVIRMGEATERSGGFALSSFDNLFWEKFSKVIK